MDDLARGWVIVMQHWHNRDLVFWIAIMLPSAIAIWIAISADRRKRPRQEDDLNFRPKPRAPLPGPDRGFR
jgi:hypothetical protein